MTPDQYTALQERLSLIEEVVIARHHAIRLKDLYVTRMMPGDAWQAFPVKGNGDVSCAKEKMLAEHADPFECIRLARAKVAEAAS